MGVEGRFAKSARAGECRQHSALVSRAGGTERRQKAVENVWGLVGGWGCNGRGGVQQRWRRRGVAQGRARVNVALVGAQNIGVVGLDEGDGRWAWVADS